ncbi:MAG: hypothetical protein K0R92_2934 [Lachnospiraceae bacterium]|jgi:hypothetical protein|nr:hypothetical protein [Lachnospiraceae bacterium]
MLNGVKFMTNEKSLISFAIMSVEWKNERDYLDMIIPFVLNSIVSDSKSNIVSISETKRKLEKEFGIKLLSNVLELIFKRLTNKDYGYLKLNNSSFFLTDKVINNEQFEKARVQATENQEYVLKELFKYYDSLQIEYNKIDVEKDLIKYLSKYGYSVLSENDFIDEDPQNIENSRIGKFIEYIYKNDNITFKYVKDIVKGAMLVSSLHMQKCKKIKLESKFKDTEIYFDTPLLIYALGYSGKAQEEAVKELINLLQDSGASVCYFEHTEDEIRGILDAYIAHYKRNTLYKSYNYDYLIEENVTDLDAEQYKIMLRSRLEKLGLKFKETLNFASEEIKKVSWSGYEKYLEDHITYNKYSSRDNDIKSVVSMYMLRKRDNYSRIENCEAIFVATNLSLVMHTNNYFREVEQRKDYQVIIDDTLLTSIVWLKCTTCSDDLPTMKLISDALASQVPNKQFWEKFIQIVDKYKEEDLITEDEANELKYESFCKYNIYQITNGDYKKVNHGSIMETLEQNNKQKHQEIQGKYEKEVNEKNKVKDMFIQEAGEKYLKKLFISDLYFGISKIWWIISTIVLYLTSNWVTGFNNLQGKSAIIVSVLTVISPLAYFILKLIEKIIDRNINFIETYFTQKAHSTYENRIRILIFQNYDFYHEEIIQYCLDRKFVKNKNRELSNA